MSAARAIVAGWLLVAVGCDGPTLDAGSYLVEPDAGRASDARVEDDADQADAKVEGDAGRLRDAGRNDAGEWRFPEERQRCANDGQCDDNMFYRVCNEGVGQCVECTGDQHCERYGPRVRCNGMVGVCWDPERPRP
ncbi:MAG: hypothetical protein RLZZ450_1761 [Pseudomonadota bacterium]|jgi:hypothetical protein